MSWQLRVVANRYADSVRLMDVARTVRGQEGIERCEMLTGTAANLEALAVLGAEATATPADLVIAVDAGPETGQAALALAEQLLSAADDHGAGAGAAVAVRPRSLPAAAAELDAANVALVSVPGEYAALEAHRALSRGMHVLLFSDHVPLASELELKRRGAASDLLVMGPGCGTAMLAGVGLGFANVVRAGSIGIVAAAGTGAQETACLIDAMGAGVAQIVGVGGRDLSPEVGGIMFRLGMRMLAAQPEIDTLLLVSKQPSPDVIRQLGDAVPEGVRVVAAFVGCEDDEMPFEVHPTLEAGAFAAVGRTAPDTGELERELDRRRARSRAGRLLGLFSGGSLAHEATTIIEPALGPLDGNVGHGSPDGSGHVVLDLGEEEYTQGRPHPMVDLDVRIERLQAAAADPTVGCVLLDVVLGYGSHPDPAAGLADAIARVAEQAVVVTSVCGTDEDPQNASVQTATLRQAGALVAPSNAAAARLALRAVA